ncbi:MAG: xylulokinase [Eubacteriales bacterium]|jgi:xylulokinase|nr:xylulokinase [Eubacteriales bacterium]
MYLIGIDIGTSGTKTVLFDLDGNVIASDTQEYPLFQPQIGWAEQDPNDWWRAVHTSIRNVVSKSQADEVAGIGLSGQMHGLVMLDRDDNVLRRSIIWCDQRTQRECEEITQIIGDGRLIEITANPALTGFTASKIRWVQKNEPHIFEKAAKIMLPKDYIRYMLTGEFATEVSDASGMQLMDIGKRSWSDEILSKLQIDKGLLGKMYESCEVTGKLSQSAASLTGLKAGIPVVGGAGDQAASAVGNGIVMPGVVSSTIGTSGVVFASTDQIKIDPHGRVHTFCHAVPGKWHVMGVTQGAGLSLKWFRDNFCQEEIAVAGNMNIDPYVLMDQIAQTVKEGSEGIIYLPYLMGERTPHLDPKAKGVFFGLTAKHTKAHLLRAVMEGVTFSLKDCLEVLSELDIAPSQVRASGGGAKSRLWRQMQADVFQKEVVTTTSSEGGALGVAILAAVGAGIYKDVQEACTQLVKVKNSVAPSSNAYRANYDKYKKIYQSLKDLF